MSYEQPLVPDIWILIPFAEQKLPPQSVSLAGTSVRALHHVWTFAVLTRIASVGTRVCLPFLLSTIILRSFLQTLLFLCFLSLPR